MAFGRPAAFEDLLRRGDDVPSKAALSVDVTKEADEADSGPAKS